MQYWKDGGTKVIIFSIMGPKQLFGDGGDTKGDVWHQISAPQRSAALWGGETEEQEGGGVQDTGWGQRGRALASAKPAAAQSRSPKPAAEPQTRRQTGRQAGVRQRGSTKGQRQGAAPRRGSAKKGKSFPGK